MLTNQERWMLLNAVPHISSAHLRRLLEAFGDLERVWRASAQELQQGGRLSARMAQAVVAGRGRNAWLREELALARRHGVRILTREDADYPAPLQAISDPPLALYVKGTRQPSDDVAVAIVGTRRASVYGLESAERLAYDLALRGVTVISGLARGIDSAAHRGALRASGRTLAVLGSGLTRLYPPEHARLADDIAERGAVISEYPMEAAPEPYNFPRRNRLISGLSLGVVVVEAAQRSGALITADCALEQGREVFAVPGPMRAVTSQGTHGLLKQGARLVTSAEDVLEELRLKPVPEAEPGTIELQEPERRVFACVSATRPQVIDAIAAQSGLEMPQVSSLLLLLELHHLVQQLPGKRFIKTITQIRREETRMNCGLHR